MIKRIRKLKNKSIWLGLIATTQIVGATTCGNPVGGKWGPWSGDWLSGYCSHERTHDICETAGGSTSGYYCETFGFTYHVQDCFSGSAFHMPEKCPVAGAELRNMSPGNTVLHGSSCTYYNP